MKIDPYSLAQAKAFAYKLLGYREHSEKEIEDRLARKGFNKAVSEKVTAGLKTAGLLDDYRFAKAFAEGRIKYKPCGLALIRSALHAKGITGDIINSVIAGIESDYDEYAAAYRIAGVRIKKFSKHDPAKAKRRICDYLLRRAFKRDVVYKVLKDFFKNGE